MEGTFYPKFDATAQKKSGDVAQMGWHANVRWQNGSVAQSAVARTNKKSGTVQCTVYSVQYPNSQRPIGSLQAVTGYLCFAYVEI